MAKKKVRYVTGHRRHTVKAKRAANNDYLVVVRGWMFIVAFALMLGIGAVVGTYFNQLLNENVPSVAGATVEELR